MNSGEKRTECCSHSKREDLIQNDLVLFESQEAVLLLHLARFRPLKDNYICFWEIRDI